MCEFKSLTHNNARKKCELSAIVTCKISHIDVACLFVEVFVDVFSISDTPINQQRLAPNKQYCNLTQVNCNIELSSINFEKLIFFSDEVPGIFIAKKELVLTCEFLSTNIDLLEDLTLNKYFTFQ
jgi:hypothetical protein